MRKIILTLIVLAAIGGAGAAYYMRQGVPEPTVTTLELTRGDVAETVQATGTLEAVETVDVGTQVSGVVQELHADFNSIVRKGQVIARLDPSIIQTQIEQARANVTRAEADLERLRVGLADAKRKYEQARLMWDKQLIPKDQLDTAELNVKTQEAQIRSSEAGLIQSRSQLNTQEVNLGHTVIKAPIDGIVISRSVDQGQTVASSMNAPTLYVLAADLTKMQVVANIDEAEIGRMRPGQPVTFRVDAYPTEQFEGLVQQVRLLPTTVQNVVTYSTVISVPNPELKLKPGMTANVTIEIARRANVLRAPAAALRFRPTTDMFAALKQEVPPELSRGFGRGGDGGQGGRGQAGFNGASGQQPPAAQPPAAQAAQRPQASSRSAAERPASRMGGGSPGGGSPRGPETAGRRGWQDGAARGEMRGGRARGAQTGASTLNATSATTIDALFAPLQPTEGRGRLWLFTNRQLRSVTVRTGVSDGSWTEILEGGDASELQPGTAVVTNLQTGLEPAQRPGQQNPGSNPLMGPQRGGPGGGRGR